MLMNCQKRMLLKCHFYGMSPFKFSKTKEEGVLKLIYLIPKFEVFSFFKMFGKPSKMSLFLEIQQHSRFMSEIFESLLKINLKGKSF